LEILGLTIDPLTGGVEGMGILYVNFINIDLKLLVLDNGLRVGFMGGEGFRAIIIRFR